MSKYKCYDCGEVFDEDDAGSVEEYHPEVHASEWFMCCPECGSEEIERYHEEEEEEEEDD